MNRPIKLDVMAWSEYFKTWLCYLFGHPGWFTPSEGKNLRCVRCKIIYIIGKGL